MALIVAITGGIGAGKSVVSNILRVMGYEVYDCDLEAKLLMDSSEEIKKDLCCLIDSRCVSESGEIDRRVLAEIVFSNPTKLERLNSIVHKAVVDDIMDRVAIACEPVFFLETALLYQSGLDSVVDRVWEVIAPVDVRVERVMKRNGFSREEVLKRIDSQNISIERPHSFITQIVNDNITPVLPAVERSLKETGI